jgi:hypothetical protein
LQKGSVNYRFHKKPGILLSVRISEKDNKITGKANKENPLLSHMRQRSHTGRKSKETAEKHFLFPGMRCGRTQRTHKELLDHKAQIKETH